MRMISEKSMRKEITRFTSRGSPRPASAWILALRLISTPRSLPAPPVRMAWLSNELQFQGATIINHTGNRRQIVLLIIVISILAVPMARADVITDWDTGTVPVSQRYLA